MKLFLAACVVALAQGYVIEQTDSAAVETKAVRKLFETLHASPLSALARAKPEKDKEVTLPSSGTFHPPKNWGPPTWFFLHSMTLALPDKVDKDKQKSIKNLLEALPLTLPCPTCGRNFAKWMKENPVTDDILSSREKMVDWMIAAHNDVNKRNKKKIYTKAEVLAEYTKAFNKYGQYDRYQAVLANTKSFAVRQTAVALPFLGTVLGLLLLN
eukprot:TRINITY_DN53600_c0_g1_i1.p1 TRINITY_DN53600_c0_g1~~TRINITY_DN53600_c0_g1_i1.p1  ORF type:complete len:213 (-),score=50.65 TRINITY_DN53600_c0_g1_i1:108-746(-)